MIRECNRLPPKVRSLKRSLIGREEDDCSVIMRLLSGSGAAHEAVGKNEHRKKSQRDNSIGGMSGYPNGRRGRQNRNFIQWRNTPDNTPRIMKLHQDRYPASPTLLLFVFNVGPEISLPIRLSTRSLYQKV